MKTMITCFFDVIRIVPLEFVSPGEMVNQSFYLEILRGLHHDLQKNRPVLWQTGDWFFHHDNAPAHTALSVQRVLTKNVMTPMPHSLFSSSLITSHFFCLFVYSMKKVLKRKCFANVEEKMAEALKGIQIDKFKNYLEQ